MESIDYLSSYYGAYDEEGRLLSKHGQVEFLTTMRYIQKYLAPGMKILEIGAGTGRYSHTLARMGYEVSAVELVGHNIEVFKSNTQSNENISIVQGNATDLSFLNDEAFDITLLLGPMYHLYTDDDAKKALSEALRVTKKGGMLFTAYCLSDASIISYGFIKGNIFNLIEKDMVETDTFKTFSNPVDIFQLYRREDIDRLMSGMSSERLHYVATDLYTNHMRETVDKMDDAMFDMYLKYHYAVCERPDLVGFSHHILDVVKKTGN